MAHSNWLYQTRDIMFQIKEWLGVDKLLSLDAYKDYYGMDDINSILDVNYKVCRDVMCPANKDADEPGAKFVGGNEHAVVTPDSFKNVYKTVMDAELGPQFGYRGDGKIPLCWYAPILEMQSAASPSIVMFWCLTQGAITVLQEFATQKQQDLFIPKLRTGEWGGTMGLTEPGAGSEVGAVQSKAFPTDTPGKYKLTGTKCFISSGDHDLAENIIHLMLAKTPGAKEGTAGISLFIVPKFWVNDDGSLGAWNDVTTMGIEHKLGIHGSTTATLSMGENDNCYGWMVGEAEVKDGRGVGMKQMFAYMNEERLNTGLFSLGCIGSAYYAALDYTKLRVQSKHSTNPKGPSVRIIEHEDVRRMLLSQKSILEACRALIYKSYLYRDLAVDAATPEEREYYDDMFAINNPMCKAYTSDMARLATGDAIQCHGGYGFTDLPAPRCGYGLAAYQNQLYLFGGWNGQKFEDTIFVYSPASNTWKTLPQRLSQPVGFIGAAALGKTIYLAGGYNGESEFNQTYAFNPATGKLQEKAPLKEKRGGLGLISGGNNLYAIGGGWLHNSSLNEKYDPATDTWTTFESPFDGQWRNLGLAAIDTTIYAVGGWDGNAEEYLDTVVSYQFLYQLFLPISSFDSK